MPLIDCLTLAKDIVDDKVKDRLLTRQANLIKEGMSEKKAGQTAINEFANEYGNKLNEDLNKLKKSIKLPTSEAKVSTKGNVDEINKKYEQLYPKREVPKSSREAFKETHGIDFDEVNNTVENIKSKGSSSGRNPLEQALLSHGLAKENEVIERTHAYADFVKVKLEETLPKKLPTNKDKINVAYADEFKGNINVLPIDQKIKPAENSPKGREISLGKYVSKDDLRPVMTGVYHDAENKALVVTDAHKLIWIDEPSVKDSKIINPKTGEKIEGNFPSYKVVIPEDNPIHVDGLNASDLINQSSGIDRANKFISGKEILSVIRVGDNHYAFDPKLLNEVVTAMAENGAKTVNIELSKPTRAIVLSTPENKNVHALVMPKQFDVEGSIPYKIIHERNSTAKEKVEEHNAELRNLQRDLETRKKELSKAVAALRKATHKDYSSAEWEVNYVKERVKEIEKQIEDKKADIDKLENPLNEVQGVQIVKDNINNGTITAEQAERFTSATNQQLSRIEPIVEDIESKAEGDNEIELNEAIKKSDELISSITKPQENAIPERSAETVSMGETPINSGEMGARISERKESTTTQEESKSTGEEEIKPPEPPKESTETVDGNDPEMTKMANAINDAFIEGKFGTEALDQVISKLQDTDIKELYNKIKDRIKKGIIDVKRVRERLMTTRQGSEEDQAALLYDLAELKGKESILQKEIIDETNSTRQKELQKQLLDVQNEMMDNALANRNIGRTASSIFRLRQLWVNKDANLADFVEQYKASKGLKDLSPEQHEEVKASYNKIRELEAKKKQLQADYEKSVAENERLKAENEKLKQLKEKATNQKKADRGKKSDESIAKSNERIQQAKNNLKKLGGNLNVGFDPRIAIEISKIAAEKFYQGVVKLDELVRNVLDDVKEVLPTWTEQDIIRHLFPNLKDEKRLTYTSRDFEASNKDARARLEAYKEAEKEYAIKMYEWQKDRRMDIMKERPFKEKAIDSILRWQRFAVLSYPSTMVKLVAVVTHQLTLKPLKFAIQKVIATALPKSVTSKMGVWGDPSLRALSAYYSGLIRNFSLANLREHFAGIDTKEVMYGKGYMYDEWAAAKGLLDMPGRSHGYIKSFIKNPEFRFAHEQLIQQGLNRMEEISRQLKDTSLTEDKRNELQDEYNRWDVTNIENMERINKLALEHGKWAILMNDNKFVDKFRVWADNKGILNSIVRSEFPVVKIPVNYVSRAFAYKYGLLKAIIGNDWAGGSTPSALKLIFKGTKNLTPQQADLFGKTLTLGSIGISFYLLGYLNKNNVKENEDGSLEIFGQHISKNLIHSPEFESIFSGAKTAQEQDKGIEFAKAMAESDLDIAKKNPFLTMLQYGFIPQVAAAMISKQNEDKKIEKVQDAAAKKITDMIIPGFLKQPAQWLDTNEKGLHPMNDYIKRYPQGDFLEKLWQNFEMGIPTMRKNVPNTKPTKKKDETATAQGD